MQPTTKYLDYLYKLERTGIKYSLRNIKVLMQALGNPHRELKCIHIAGTNGKGATASFIASILMECGLKTGLFTSPHILKFNERIRINGNCISDYYIKKFLRDNKKIIYEIKPSFFEVNTALAFKYFADKKVDAAVIEAGLGGRLDSTNIIKPLLTVITQIGIDHTEYLGNTLEEIAKEKIGIAKKGVDVIVSDNHKELRKLFERAKGELRGAKLYFLDDSSNRDDISTYIPLPGDYQVRNAAAAILAVEKFFNSSKFDVQSSKLQGIDKGLRNVVKNTGYRCRLEQIKHRDKNYILDVSHNPDGIDSMLETAKKVLKSYSKCLVIFAMMKEKDYKSSINKLINFADYIIFTKPDYERALQPEIMYEYAQSRELGMGFFAPLRMTAKVKEALKLAKKLSGKNDIILITGSFFLVSDAIKELRIQKKFV